MKGHAKRNSVLFFSLHLRGKCTVEMTKLRMKSIVEMMHLRMKSKVKKKPNIKMTQSRTKKMQVKGHG
jgi:hypothetical protein